MTRFTKYIALVATLAFAVSTVGLPVVINYCTMQATYRTGGACCACPSPASASGPRISARPCIEHTELGAPLGATYTAPVQHVQCVAVVIDVITANVLQPCSLCRFLSAGDRSAAPPPLLRTSILLI